jgi:hypothetical protein
MQGVLNFLMIIMFAIPAGAAILLWKRLRDNGDKEDSKDRVLEAIYAEKLRNSMSGAVKAAEDTVMPVSPEKEQPQETEIKTETSAVPERRPMRELTDEERIELAKQIASDTLAEERRLKEQKAAELSPVEAGVEKKLSREEAIKLVSDMLGVREKKKSSYEELRMMRNEMIKKQKESSASEKSSTPDQSPEKKLTKEQALDMVSDMIGNAKSRK